MQLLAPDDPRPIHFVGIAGAGMSALALIARGRGVAVTGCDTHPSGAEELVRAGADVSAGHDAGHVVFGCDTNLRGETLIDTWTVVATTAGLRGYLQYFKYPQVNAIFAEVGYFRILIESCKVLPDVGRVFYRGFRQDRKWPWNDFRKYLDKSLFEIRSEFDIKVVPVRAFGAFELQFLTSGRA